MNERFGTSHWMSALVFASVVVISVGCQATQSQRNDSFPPATELVARGEVLYTASCLRCHGGATGGQMMDLPPPHNANGHTWHHPDCQLIDIVLNGLGEMGEMMRRMHGATEATPRMPAFKGQLSEEDVRAILAYIKTWWTEDQRRMQATMTQAQCAEVGGLPAREAAGSH